MSCKNFIHLNFPCNTSFRTITIVYMKEGIKEYNLCEKGYHQLWCGSQRISRFHSEWWYTLSLLPEDKKTHKSIFHNYLLVYIVGSHTLTVLQCSYNCSYQSKIMDGITNDWFVIPVREWHQVARILFHTGMKYIGRARKVRKDK
jgi:hypothetical protein